MILSRIVAPLCLSALCLAFTAKEKDGKYNAPGYCAAEVKFVCPVDGHEFASPVAYSTTNEGTRRDLMQVNGEGKLYEHLVHQCPKCHYSGTREDFEEELTVDQRNLILKYLARNAPRKLDQVQENIVAADIYKLLGAYDYARADFYLYASYLVRNKPAKIAERKAYQLKAAELYLSREFGTDAESLKAKAQNYYLAAELYRRAGRFDLATEMFAQADNVAVKPDGLASLIEEQSSLALERNDNNNL